MAEVKLINESENEFTDISSEEERCYYWPDGDCLRIKHPQWLAVSKSGGHRILDKEETCYYVKSGWRYITWSIEDKGNGKPLPHFVK